MSVPRQPRRIGNRVNVHVFPRLAVYGTRNIRGRSRNRDKYVYFDDSKYFFLK
ncbi:uncharacterized protein H6S33_011232, partial [Morchella sextelata]|uniref:uncharacterized protein n=1 Tax=Morchella sextelata TaxID=1174677 RepID=UPI001D0568AA